MFRYALAAYMLVLSLTGPNPCCCTLSRLVAMTTSWARTSDGQQVQWPSCCQEQVASNSDNKPDQPQSCCRLPGSPGSKGPTERCKCEKSLCNAVPAPNTEFTIELNRSWWDELAVNLATPLMLEAGDLMTTAVQPDVAPFAIRSGREIRIELHSWRC